MRLEMVLFQFVFTVVLVIASGQIGSSFATDSGKLVMW